MTGTLRFGWGPELNHFQTYGGTPVAGYSLVAAPSGFASTYAFKAVNPGASEKVGQGPASANFAAQPYTWPVITFRAEGTFTDTPSVTKFAIIRWFTFSGGSPFNAIGLRGVGQSGGTYKVELVDNGGTTNGSSTSTYASGANLTIRMEYDGTNCRVWINGSLEITYATSNKPAGPMVMFWYLGSDMATVTKYWGSYGLVTSTTSADRPGTTLGSHRLDPNGNTAETDYGDEGDCTDPTQGDYINWDDYVAGGTPNDGTDHNCGEAANKQEVSALTTASTSDTIMGVISHHWLRSNVASKTVTNYSRLKQSGSASEVTLDNLDSTTWAAQQAVFTTAPGGGAWSIADLELGHRVVSGNGANAEVSAIAAEVITLDSDPPPVTDRRRAPVQVF